MRMLVFVLLAFPVHANTWVVGPRPHGEVRFIVPGPLDDVPGLTREVSGSLELPPGRLPELKGLVSVPLDTLKTGIDQRDEDMRVEFLETARFPFALLVIDRVERTSSTTLEPGKETQGEAIGSFELHGKRRAVRVPVTFKLEDEQRLWVTGTLELPFSDYGIVRPKRLFLKLGESAQVRFKVLFVPKREENVPVVAKRESPTAPTVIAVLPSTKPKPRPKPKAPPKVAAMPRQFTKHPDELVRTGEALFFSVLPGRESRLSCSHCHAAADERAGLKQADGYIRPASTVWNSAHRPNFWGGLAKTVGGATEICVRKFVDEEGLKPEERSALDAYLLAISPDPAPDYYYSTLYRTLESPVPDVLAGNAKEGERKTKLHCGVCHDGARAAPKLERALYEPDWVVRRVRWLPGHQSYACPPTRMTRLNDTDLRDIVTFLSGPAAGEKIFKRP